MLPTILEVTRLMETIAILFTLLLTLRIPTQAILTQSHHSFQTAQWLRTHSMQFQLLAKWVRHFIWVTSSEVKLISFYKSFIKEMIFQLTETKMAPLSLMSTLRTGTFKTSHVMTRSWWLELSFPVWLLVSLPTSLSSMPSFVASSTASLTGPIVLLSSTKTARKPSDILKSLQSKQHPSESSRLPTALVSKECHSLILTRTAFATYYFVF